MATTIKSDTVTVNASQEAVFLFLTDFNNIKQLLPKDKISDWESDQDACSFKIQNAATIPLIKDTTVPSNKINIKSGPKAPFPFKLEVFINPLDGGDSCETYFEFNGEINAFLKMMVMKPLTNLFNYMAKRVKDVHA